MTETHKRSVEVVRRNNQRKEKLVERNLQHGIFRWTQEKIDRLLEMVQEGQPYSKIGKDLGTTEGAIGAEVFALRNKGVIPKRIRKSSAIDED